jgi:hypothetical protein
MKLLWNETTQTMEETKSEKDSQGNRRKVKGSPDEAKGSSKMEALNQLRGWALGGHIRICQQALKEASSKGK